jgi:hypothetical protein
MRTLQSPLRSIVIAAVLASPLAALATTSTDASLDEAQEWSDALILPGSIATDASALEQQPFPIPTPFYRYLCSARSRSRNLTFFHSANSIGQAQFRSLSKCRYRMDSYGYYPGYCQLVSCVDRFN